jgi:hypothetical protein
MRTNPNELAQLPRVCSRCKHRWRRFGEMRLGAWRWAQAGARKAVELRASPITLVRSRRPDVMGRLVRHSGRRAPSDPRFCLLFSGSQRKNRRRRFCGGRLGYTLVPYRAFVRDDQTLWDANRQALYPALRAPLPPAAKRQYLSRTNRWPKLRWLRLLSRSSRPDSEQQQCRHHHRQADPRAARDHARDGARAFHRWSAAHHHARLGEVAQKPCRSSSGPCALWA